MAFEKKDPVILEGPIRKLGHGRGKFYDRYLVLRSGGRLLYYHAKPTAEKGDDSGLRRTYLLNKNTVVSEVQKRDESHKKAAFIFKVTWGPGEVNAINQSAASLKAAKDKASGSGRGGGSDLDGHGSDHGLPEGGFSVGGLSAWIDGEGGDGSGHKALSPASDAADVAAALASKQGRKERRVRQAKIAATAAGGVLIGVFTAGVGLVAGAVVAAVGAAAGGGVAAYEAAKDKEAHILVLCCDSAEGAARWRSVLKKQVQLLAAAAQEVSSDITGQATSSHLQSQTKSQASESAAFLAAAAGGGDDGDLHHDQGHGHAWAAHTSAAEAAAGRWALAGAWTDAERGSGFGGFGGGFGGLPVGSLLPPTSPLSRDASAAAVPPPLPLASFPAVRTRLAVRASPVDCFVHVMSTAKVVAAHGVVGEAMVLKSVDDADDILALVFRPQSTSCGQSGWSLAARAAAAAASASPHLAPLSPACASAASPAAQASAVAVASAVVSVAAVGCASFFYWLKPPWAVASALASVLGPVTRGHGLLQPLQPAGVVSLGGVFGGVGGGGLGGGESLGGAASEAAASAAAAVAAELKYFFLSVAFGVAALAWLLALLLALPAPPPFPWDCGGRQGGGGGCDPRGATKGPPAVAKAACRGALLAWRWAWATLGASFGLPIAALAASCFGPLPPPTCLQDGLCREAVVRRRWRKDASTGAYVITFDSIDDAAHAPACSPPPPSSSFARSRRGSLLPGFQGPPSTDGGGGGGVGGGGVGGGGVGGGGVGAVPSKAGRARATLHAVFTIHPFVPRHARGGGHGGDASGGGESHASDGGASDGHAFGPASFGSDAVLPDLGIGPMDDSGPGGGGNSSRDRLGGGGDGSPRGAYLSALVGAAEGEGNDMRRAEAAQCLLTVCVQADPGQGPSASPTAARSAARGGGLAAGLAAGWARRASSDQAARAARAFAEHLLGQALDVRGSAEGPRFLSPCFEDQRNRSLLTGHSPEGGLGLGA